VTAGICLGCALVPGASAALYKVFKSGARAAKWVEKADEAAAASLREERSGVRAVVEVPLSEYQNARRAGRYGNMNENLAMGQFAHSYIGPQYAAEYKVNRYLGSECRPDLWKRGSILEIKPYKEGVDPFTAYGGQMYRYRDAHSAVFGEYPQYEFILYRWV